jgi:NADH dehydrogenase (ubiquinone) 1 alpha subcomplex subunit 9
VSHSLFFSTRKGFKGSRRPQKAAVDQSRQIQVAVKEGRPVPTSVVATVFGCTGFLGRFVVNMLARSGAQVFVPYRGNEMWINHLKVMGDVGQIVPVKYHLRDEETIRHALRYSNVVVNLVGRMWETRNFTFEDVHVTGAQTLAKVARRAGVERFIHFSVVNPDPNSPSKWMQSKAKGEAAVRSEFPTATIIRPTIAIGMEDAFISRIAHMMRFWPVTIRYQRNRRFQPALAADVARAVIETLITTDAIGKTYEVGGPKIYTMDEIYDLVQILLRFDPLKTVTLSDKTMILLSHVLWKWNRRPRFTPDTLRDVADRVVSGKYPGFASLGISPQPIEEHCNRIVRRFRRHAQFDDIIEDLPNKGTLATNF